MKDTNPRIALYKEAMSLEEKRAALQSQLDDVARRIADIQGKLFSTAVSASSSSAGASSAPVVRAAATRVSLIGKRARRGELKTQLLRALASAGSAGISVKEITAATGAKATSVHSWLQAARKTYPIKRLSQGLYRLEGGLPADASGDSSASAPAPAKGRRGGKVGRPSKRSSRPLSKRGELMSRIMEELKSAGSAGVKIPDLADKFGVKRKNLFIWFATTGRRNPAIKKVGESHYRLDA